MKWTVVRQYPEPAVKQSWDEFLTRADYPAYYVSPDYFREPFFRDKNPFAVLAWDGACVVGVLVGLHEGGQVTSGLLSRPQVCFDKSADKASVSECLVEGVMSEAGDAGLLTIFTWSEIDWFVEHGFRHLQEQGVVMLDLTRGADDVFKDFSANRRTNVRKAIKKGLEVSIATTKEEFRAYYDIYVDWSKRKGLEYTSYEVMEEALMLTDFRKLFLARFNGAIVAGVVIRMHPTGTIAYAANSSIEASLSLKPNDVLHWRVIEWACKEGYKRYNLGGTHLFLRKMGGTIIPSHRYRIDRTLLHRFDIEEALRMGTSRLFHAMPDKVQETVRRVLSHSE